MDGHHFGLHRYAGNPHNIKLRIVFTKEAPVCPLTHGGNHRRVPSDAQSDFGDKDPPAIYLLSKDSNNNWIVTQEQSESHADCSNLSHILTINGYTLRAVSKRLGCAKKRPYRKSDINLAAGEQNGNASSTIHNKDGTLNDGTHGRSVIRTNLDELNTSTSRRQAPDVGDSVLLPERARYWRDVPYSVTSEVDRDYGQRTRARKLRSVTREDSEKSPNPLRNHYTAEFEHCPCPSNNALHNLEAESECSCNSCVLSCGACFRLESLSDNRDLSGGHIDSTKIVDYNPAAQVGKSNQSINYCRSCCEYSEQFRRLLCALHTSSKNSASFLELLSTNLNLGITNDTSDYLPAITSIGARGEEEEDDENCLLKLLAHLKVGLSEDHRVDGDLWQSRKDQDSNPLDDDDDDDEKKAQIEQHDDSKASVYPSCLPTDLKKFVSSLARNEVGSDKTRPGFEYPHDGSHGEVLFVMMEKYAPPPISTSERARREGSTETDKGGTSSTDKAAHSTLSEDVSNIPKGEQSRLDASQTFQAKQATDERNSQGFTRKTGSSVKSGESDNKRDHQPQESGTTQIVEVANQKSDSNQDGASNKIKLDEKENSGSLGRNNYDTHDSLDESLESCMLGALDDRNNGMQRRTSGKLRTTVLPPQATNVSREYERDDSVVVCDQVGLGERQCSVLLCVIVIDVLGRALLLKPDINEPIALDLGNSATLACPTRNEQPTIINMGTEYSSMRQLKTFDFAHSLTSSTIFYHVETMHSPNQSNDCDQILKSVRNQFELTSSIERPLPISDTSSPLSISKHLSQDKSIFLNPMDGNMLILMQLDILSASGFAKDCGNIYVKYRIYHRTSEHWRLRLLDSAKHDSHVGNSVRGPVSLRGEVYPAPNPRQHPIVRADTNKPCPPIVKATDGGALERTSYMGNEKVGLIADEANVNDDFVGDNDELLVEGSSITSCANSKGIFNFSCVESFVFELSKFPTGSSGDEVRPKGDSDAPGEQSTKQEHRQDKESLEEGASCEKERQKSSQLNGELSVVGGAMLQSSLASALLQPKTETNRVATGSVAPTITESDVSMAQAPRVVELNINEDDDDDDDRVESNTDHSNGADKNLERHNITAIDDINNICSSISRDDKREKATCDNCLPSDEKFCQRHTMNSEIVNQQKRRQCVNLLGALDDTCEITLSLEVYSSTYYFDKLQGLSHIKKRISLERLESKTLNGGTTSHVIPAARSQSKRNKKESATHEVPVIRPTLCAPLDRLRYRLIGEMPKRTPNTRDVSHFV